MNKFSP